MLNVHCERAGHLQSMVEGLDCTQTVLYIKERERERAGRLENLGVDVVKKLEKLEECGIGPETMSPMRTRDFY